MAEQPLSDLILFWSFFSKIQNYQIIPNYRKTENVRVQEMFATFASGTSNKYIY
jgi:hypothetical protein